MRKTVTTAVSEIEMTVVVTPTLLRFMKEFNELYHRLNGDEVTFEIYSNSLRNVASDIYKELIDMGYIPVELLKRDTLEELFLQIENTVPTFEIDNFGALFATVYRAARLDYNVDDK